MKNEITTYIGLKATKAALAQLIRPLTPEEREALQLLREEAAAQGRTLCITNLELIAKVNAIQVARLEAQRKLANIADAKERKAAADKLREQQKAERKATLQRSFADRKAEQKRLEALRKEEREIRDSKRKEQAAHEQQAENARINAVAETRSTAQIVRMGERLLTLRAQRDAANEACNSAEAANISASERLKVAPGRLAEANCAMEEALAYSEGEFTVEGDDALVELYAAEHELIQARYAFDSSRDKLLLEQSAKARICARIAKLEAILKRIVDIGEKATSELAKGVLTAKAKEQAEPEDTSSGRWSYSVMVAKAKDFLPVTLIDALEALKHVGKNGTSQMILDALDAIERELAIGNGQWVANSKQLEQRKLSQSELAEIFGVEQGKLTRQICVVEHAFWAWFTDAYSSRKIEGHEDLRQRIADVCRTMLDKLGANGVTIEYGPQILRMKPFVANASGLKKGIVVAAERGALAKNMPFLTFGQVLSEMTKISGTDLYKVFALFMTPSRTFTYGAECRVITQNDVIVVNKMTMRVPVEDATKVGEGMHKVPVPVAGQTDPVYINVAIKQVGKTEIELEVFDGQLMGNLPGLKKAIQVRGMGLKGMALLFDVGLLLSRLPDLADQAEEGLLVRNIDGDEERLTEGRIVGTTSVFKAKTFFAGDPKPLARWRRNIKALRERTNSRGNFVADYGFLREASASEDELTTDRSTSRQMLQQMLSIGFDEALIDDLVSDTIGRAANLRTFSGAFRRLAKFGREATPLSELAKLVPELAAAPWLQHEALTSMLTDVADAASGRIDSVGVNAIVTCDPAAFCRALKAQHDTGAVDVTDFVKSEVKVGQVHIGQLRANLEAVLIRYPSSDSTIDVYVTVHVDVYEDLLPETVAVLNPGDPIFFRADMDVDGDHIQIHIHLQIVAAAKAALRIFKWLGMGTTIFEHGEGVKKGPYTADFVRQGMVDAMLNGQMFNLVGPFSNLATRFWDMLGVTLAFVKAHTGEVQAKAIERARDIAACIKMASTAAILCIDWCKTGVPAEGTVGRTIFDAASALRKWAPKPFRGKMPWNQIFADDDAEHRFQENAMAEERISATGRIYRVWKVAAPNCGLMDKVAMACLSKVGIDVDFDGEIDMHTICFDAEGVVFDPAKIGFDPTMKGAGKGIVHCKAIANLNPNDFEDAGDRAVIQAAKEGKPVGFTDVAYFLYHQRAAMEKRLASQFEKADEGDIVADTRREYLAAARTILLTMTGFNWKDGDPNDPIYRYKVLVNTAIGLFLKPGISSNEKNLRRQAEIRAKFSKWILEVVAPDILLLVYDRLGAEIPEWVLESTNLLSEKEVDDGFVGGDFDEDVYLPSPEEEAAFYSKLA